MRFAILVPAAFALATMAAPAMAQDYYGRFDGSIPITGAQMTDFPSGRANMTRTGSMLAPEVPDQYAPVRYHHRHRYEERRDYRYDDYRYNYNR